MDVGLTPSGKLSSGKISKADMAMINLSFEPDKDSPPRFPPAKEKPNKDDIYTLELQESDGNYKESSEEYEPYDNRDVKKPTTNNETFFHLLKGSLGTGILAMPNAFSHSGYVLGVVGTIVIGIMCTYCIHMLIKTEYELCRRKRKASLTYPEVAIISLQEGPAWCKAIAPYSGIIVNTFLLVYQIGTCCVYVVFMSENLKKVVDLYLENDLDLKIYMVAILGPLILINWVRNLKYLAPLSQIANGITVVSFGIILYYLFREAPTFEGKQAFGKVLDYPLFFGTVLFALEAIGVILPLENEMKHPQNFGSKWGVLNKAMCIIIILYVGMGLFGYLKYGSGALGSITLNLPGQTEVAAQVVQILLASAIYVTHGLACYVAIDITWNQYLKKKFAKRNGRIFFEYLVRTVIVLITFLLAVSVPALDLFISLFGALCLSALGIAFPAIIESSAYWYETDGRSRFWMTLKNVILVVIGVLGLITGTYTSLKEIIREFS